MSDVITVEGVKNIIKDLESKRSNVTDLPKDSTGVVDGSDWIEDGIREAVENAYSHKIMIFQIKRVGASQPITYHFHFLLTRKHGENVIICLDTSDTIPISSEDPSSEEIFEVVEAVIKGFIAKANLIDKDADWVEQKFYFNRADQRIWDKFNSIKEMHFVNYAKDAIESEKFIIAGIKEESQVQFG